MWGTLIRSRRLGLTAGVYSLSRPPPGASGNGEDVRITEITQASGRWIARPGRSTGNEPPPLPCRRLIGSGESKLLPVAALADVKWSARQPGDTNGAGGKGGRHAKLFWIVLREDEFAGDAGGARRARPRDWHRRSSRPAGFIRPAVEWRHSLVLGHC